MFANLKSWVKDLLKFDTATNTTPSFTSTTKAFQLFILKHNFLEELSICWEDVSWKGERQRESNTKTDERNQIPTMHSQEQTTRGCEIHF